MGYFEQQLKVGQIGESKIAMWLQHKGWNVLPVYEKEIDNGKGPRIFTPLGNIIAPDLLVMKKHNHQVLWIEAKHKSVFSWHRRSRQWVTGIDIRHYEDYKKLLTLSPWPVWLMFLHQKDRCDTRNEPWPCPTGLYGHTLLYLTENESHRHTNWANGMVYWSENTLLKLAPIAEIQP